VAVNMVNRNRNLRYGSLNVYARFHSSQIRKVSNLLAVYTSDSENARVDWLGPSQGIINDIHKINEDYPVSIVTFEIPVDGTEPNLNKIRQEEGIIAEAMNNKSVDSAFRVIIYSNHPVEGFSSIDRKTFIYEFLIHTPELSLIRKESNEKHIMRIRYFIRIVNEKLEVTVFLPTSTVYEYYSILYKIARENKQDIIVKYLLPYSQEIWEFI
jgi:hypothetical protein